MAEKRITTAEILFTSDPDESGSTRGDHWGPGIEFEVTEVDGPITKVTCLDDDRIALGETTGWLSTPDVESSSKPS